MRYAALPCSNENKDSQILFSLIALPLSMLAIGMQLKFKRIHPSAKIPQYQTRGAAGFDFYSVEDAHLKAGEVSLVATGLSVEIPEGFELQIRARSGLSAKWGVFLVNGIGTVDSDYRGEIKIILSTCTSGLVYLKAGERIAQGVLTRVTQAVISETTELSETERGMGGFGSTGTV
jgi:dUTP pyrophosphatase